MLSSDTLKKQMVIVYSANFEDTNIHKFLLGKEVWV